MATHVSDFASLRRTAPRDSLEPWLRSVTVALGGGMLIFFLPILLLLPFRVQLPPALVALVRWGPGGAEQYEEMIAAISAVWGYYILRAARDPLANELFLDFTAFANLAHTVLMTLMAVVNKDDRIHLVGDILGAWLLLGPFLYVWGSVKKERRNTSRR